jgi:hypothetical protein
MWEVNMTHFGVHKSMEQLPTYHGTSTNSGANGQVNKGI